MSALRPRALAFGVLTFVLLTGTLSGLAMVSSVDRELLPDPVLAGVIAGIAVLGSQVQLSFTLGRVSVPFSLDGPTLIVGMVFLHPAVAAGVAALVLVLDIPGIQGGRAAWKLALNGLISACAALAGGTLAFLTTGNEPSAMLVLPLAMAVAAVDEVVQIATYGTFFELSEPGSGKAFIRTCTSVPLVNVLGSAIAASMVAPFVASPLLLAVVLGGLLLVFAAAARMSTSENLHRVKNAYLRDVFGRYVPSHVADSLAESGEEIKLGGEQRDITVLFCDIRGFTAWSETAEAETIITQLNVLLGELSGAVMSTEGTLDKYTGDGLMAFWGAPLEQPDHAARALEAAEEMLRRLAHCNDTRAEDGLPPFAIGIGIHSGPAVVGNVGHEQRLDYTAIGDTVNTSARLEAATKDVGSVILLSQGAVERLPTDRRARCARLGAIKVKGKSHPVDVFAPQGSADLAA